jgi:hypothetical protein
MESGERFAVESTTFDAHRSEWIEKRWEHKWVVVMGSDFRGPFDAPSQAWNAGVAAWGPGFLMRRVEKQDLPVVLSSVCLSPREGGSS